MAITIQSSPLVSAANKIVSTNSKSKGTFVKLRNDYQKFGDFLDLKVLELERTQLPNTNTLRKLTNINISNTFGSAGGLLGGLLGGALDLGGLIRGFFPGGDKKIGSNAPSTRPSPRPGLRGNRLRIGGPRAFGVANALFAGLDFATGLAEGESVGKSAAGTAGSLAGSLLGGAIGQTLIPIPGLGFVIGSMAGSFIGGWTADRAYEAATGNVKKQQEDKLERTRQNQPGMEIGTINVERQNTILNTFSSATSKFETFVKDILQGKVSVLPGTSANDIDSEYGPYPDRDSGDNNIPGDFQEVDAEGGSLPSSYPITGRYGDQRPTHTHKGVDYSAPTGTPISVIQPGVVTRSGWIDGYGYGVQVDHPGGINSFYGHLSKINVKTGDNVEPGRIIGEVGSTGNSTGPHLHFEVDLNGKVTNPISYADRIFRFGGSVRVRNRPGTSGTQAPSNPSTSGLRPGQTTTNQFGRQSSMPAASLQGRNRSNMKGYLIVPGHISGDGATGESEAVRKIARYIVSHIQAMYPGIPIQLWDNRNYPQTQAGFSKQMDDLKKKEQEGWEIIELHLDAPGGSGRGVITPYDRSQLNPLEASLAGTIGVYPRDWRVGGKVGVGDLLGGPRRGLTLVELANATPELIQAIMRDDPRAYDYVGRDFINTVGGLVESGGFPGYRAAPPRSQVAPSPSRRQDVSYQLPYNRTASQIALLNSTTVIAAPGGGGQRAANVPSTPLPRSQSSSMVAFNPIDPRDPLNTILYHRLF